MAGEAKKMQTMHMLKLQPSAKWSLVWGYIHRTIFRDGLQSTYYILIHDISPTNIRRDRKAWQGNHTRCPSHESSFHNLMECGVTKAIWTSSCGPLALTFCSLEATLRTDRFNIKKFYVVPTLRLCVLCGSQNKQQLLPYTALTDWLL
jgi:hypothetical protein